MPSTWRQIALQYLATVGTGSKDTVNAVEDGEHPFIVRSAEPLAIDTFTFDTEAILTAGDGAVGEIFHHIKGKFDAHQRVYVIHDFQGIDGRYLRSEEHTSELQSLMRISYAVFCLKK